jgi:hypothetical protein
MRAGRIVTSNRVASGARARSGGAIAALFALGSVLTLVDALLTRTLLRDTGTIERWMPVRRLMETFGIDVALVICSTLAVVAMAMVAWSAVRARSTIASLSFFVLCAVVSVRVWGCVNNFGILLN